MPEPQENYIIIGTAGHIDHGKTELIKRLTGIDTDRLQEEKVRGITIDLGFAYYDLDSGIRVGIIDVPGHERFVRNMLAGATGIDFLLLVIAADAGVMPQTTEHLQICQLLGISNGLVVVTKTDLVDDEWLELVCDEIKDRLTTTFLGNAPVVPVSSVTGEGFPLLIDFLNKMIPTVPKLKETRTFRLPIDRSFTIQGFGTVVTGTVFAGSLALGDTVEILPGDLQARVRSLQVHHTNVDKVWTGQRVAVNLQGIEKRSVVRGQMLCERGANNTVLMCDARLSVLEDAPRPVKYRSRVRFHHGTSEVMARIIPLESEIIQPGESQYVQIRLESPIVALNGDRFVVRSYSPLRTIAGGVILAPRSAKHTQLSNEESKTLKALEHGNLDDKVSALIHIAGIRGISIESLLKQLGFPKTIIMPLLKQKIDDERLFSLDREMTYLVDDISLDLFIERIVAQIDLFHKINRLKSGITKEELRSKFPFVSLNAFNNILEYVLKDPRIEQTDDKIHRLDHKISMKQDEQKIYSAIQDILKKRKFSVPSESDIIAEIGEQRKKVNNVLQIMVNRNEILIIKPNLIFQTEFMKDIIDQVISFLKENKTLTVADVKKLFDYSRKHAIPLLEYLDNLGVTNRTGDVRVLGPNQNYS